MLQRAGEQKTTHLADRTISYNNTLDRLHGSPGGLWNRKRVELNEEEERKPAVWCGQSWPVQSMRRGHAAPACHVLT